MSPQRTAAAVTIQRIYRGHLTRRILRARHVAARKIQTYVRAHLARRAFRSQHARVSQRQSLEAAAHQTRNRIKERERMLALLRTVPDVHAWEARRTEDAVRTLQRWWRGERVRWKHRQNRRASYATESSTLAAARAATSISPVTEKPNEKSPEQPPPPVVHADRKPIYDAILAHLMYRRKEPLRDDYYPPSDNWFSQPQESPERDISHLIQEIDSYINYIKATSADISSGMVSAEPIAPVKTKNALREERNEHLRAHRRAKGAWWENRTKEEWDAWINEQTIHPPDG
ncbi:hypothetical protein HDU86_005024 [Geranomyces michiganensis]|nr:hypothetical protein HDU86_005024 [Geranomyces michiganensis]